MGDKLAVKMAKRQMIIPLRSGGLGLRSQARISSVAFLSSFAASAPLLSTLLRTTDNNPHPLSDPAYSALDTAVGNASQYTRTQIVTTDLLRPSTPDSASSLQQSPTRGRIRSPTKPRSSTLQYNDAQRRLTSPVPASTTNALKMLLPLNQSHTAIAFYCQQHASFFRMQSTLCGAIDNQLHESLLDAARSMLNESDRDYHLSRCRAVSAPQASTWLTVPPRADNKFTHLHDIHYSLAIRLRLGLAFSTSMPTDCVCKNDQVIQSGIISTNPTHFFDCPLLKKRGVNNRHNMVRDQFHIAAQRANMVAEREPAYALPAKDGKRPDALFIYGPSVPVAHRGCVGLRPPRRPIACGRLPVPPIPSSDSAPAR